MHLIDTKLNEREVHDRPIQCGILGAGEMSQGLVNQITRHVPGMRVAAIYNRTRTKAVQCYQVAGVIPPLVNEHDDDDDAEEEEKNNEVCFATDTHQVEKAVHERKACIVESAELLWKTDTIDVIVEMTGTIQEAFAWITAALQHQKKVVSFNAELDATIGPYLQRIAQDNNTKYTLGDGDQPGVTMNLYRQVKMMGFTPLVCGNIKGFLNNHRTPDDQKHYAELYGLSTNMVTSFTDWTKVALEQASIANATGMQVAQRGMMAIRHEGKHIDELVNSYNVEELQKLGGIVEMVVGAQPGPGVFIFATSDDPVSKRFLKYGKLGDGPLYSFYVPYHLLFFELPFSIARLVDFDDGTLDALEEMKVEVVAIAKRDLKAGEVLDGIGGFLHYGLCENSSTVQSEKLLPVGLAQGKVLLRDIAKDDAISWEDVRMVNTDSDVNQEESLSALEKAYRCMMNSSNERHRTAVEKAHQTKVDTSLRSETDKESISFSSAQN
jgi:predicted homoserine dehydrogenase-like protein